MSAAQKAYDYYAICVSPIEEKLKGLPPEIIDKKFARLQDKDERKNATATQYQQCQSEYPGDDVFFSE